MVDGFFCKQLWWPGKAVSNEPINEGSEIDKKSWKSEPFVEVGEKADFSNRRRVGSNQLVSRTAKLTDQLEFKSLKIFDASPNQVRRTLAGFASKIFAIDEGGFDSS